MDKDPVKRAVWPCKLRIFCFMGKLNIHRTCDIRTRFRITKFSFNVGKYIHVYIYIILYICLYIRVCFCVLIQYMYMIVY